MDRARITIPDVLFILFTFAVLAAIYPIFIDLFETNQDVIPQGAELLYSMILPMMLLILFTVIYVKAAGGMQA